MRLNRFVLFAMAAATVLCLSAPANAQFRNNGIQLPNAGVLVLGCMSPFGYPLAGVGTLCGGNDDYQQFYGPFNPVINGRQTNGWDATHQATLGTSYFRALGYNLWLDVQVVVGMGSAVFVDVTRFGGLFQPIVSLQQSTGLRYNFLDEEYRPFISGHLHILWMPNAQGTSIRFNQLDFVGFNTALWAGVRAGGGFEWFFLPTFRKNGMPIDIFYDEMSLQVEGNIAVFADLAGIPLVAQIARLSYNVYF